SPVRSPCRLRSVTHCPSCLLDHSYVVACAAAAGYDWGRLQKPCVWGNLSQLVHGPSISILPNLPFNQPPMMTTAPMLRTFAPLAALLLTGLFFARPAAAEQGDQAAKPNTLSEVEKKAGWKLLFDGRTAEGWRNYKADGIHDGWQVVDGEL